LAAVFKRFFFPNNVAIGCGDQGGFCRIWLPGWRDSSVEVTDPGSSFILAFQARRWFSPMGALALLVSLEDFPRS
jgi:hypothetical protein